MNKLLDAYNDLSLEEKRNQLSNELLFIGELINQIQKIQGIASSNLVIKNYDDNIHNQLSESDMLLFIYEDIYNIQQELLNIISYLIKNCNKQID